MDAGAYGSGNNSDNAGRPTLFVMNMQEGVINPAVPEGTSTTHLAVKTESILAAVSHARACGVRIVWLFHAHGEGAAHHLPEKAGSGAWRRQLQHAGDIPLKNLPIQADDDVIIQKSLAHTDADYMKKTAQLLGITPASMVAGCGFYADEPCKDGLYLWAHTMHDHGFTPTILEDLTDNPVSITPHGVAAMNIQFLKRISGGIVWKQSAVWLEAACAEAARFVQEKSAAILPLHPLARAGQGIKHIIMGGYRAKSPCACTEHLAA